jgi:hypothetical protein
MSSAFDSSRSSEEDGGKKPESGTSTDDAVPRRARAIVEPTQIDQPTAVSYKLQLPKACNIHDTFHVSRLKPATDEIFSNRPDAMLLPTPAESSIEDVYEIEALLDHDLKYNVL